MLYPNFRLSLSKYKDYKICPLMFYLKYIKRVPYFQFADNWYIGWYMQDLLDRFFTGDLVSLSSNEPIFQAKYVEGYLFAQDIQVKNHIGQEVIDKLREDMLKALSFIKILTPESSLHIEKTYDVLYEDSSAKVRLRGRPDYIIERDGYTEISDGKYGKHRLDETSLLWYSLIYWLQEGRVPDRASYIYYRHKDYIFLSITKERLIDFYFSEVKPALLDLMSYKVRKPAVTNCRFCPYSSSSMYTICKYRCKYQGQDSDLKIDVSDISGVLTGYKNTPSGKFGSMFSLR